MLHKLKPVPRALVILAIVGGAGYALTMVDFSKFKKAPAPVTAETVEAPPVTVVTPASAALQNANTAVQAATQAAQQASPAPAPTAPAAPSGLTPAVNDAGLDAVLRAKK